MDKNTMYQVKNRSAGIVTYHIREDNIHRRFAAGEIKKISFGELEKLTFQAGGPALLNHFLQILGTEEVTTDLGINVEPEYNMSETDVAELLRNGSLEAFLDCLDFAPIGVIDLVKTLAVKLPLENTQKKQALKNKTGFDVDEALKLTMADQENAEEAPTRRVQAEQPVQTGRRTSGSNYKIIKTAE